MRAHQLEVLGVLQNLDMKGGMLYPKNGALLTVKVPVADIAVWMLNPDELH